MDPNSGAARKALRGVTQGGSTFVREDEAAKLKADRPFPPKAKRLALIFIASLLALVALPAILELAGVPVHIGPWLSLLITLPGTLIAMGFMGFLRDGMWPNIVSGAVVLFCLSVAYATEFDPGDEQRAILVRSAAVAVCVVMLAFFLKSLKTSLRDLHYMIAQGESMQDIMMRYQQAAVIKKSGGKPAMTEEGKVVDANELMPKKGFRQKPQKTKKQQGEKTKRSKPKVR